MNRINDKLLTLEEVAEFLRVKRSYAYKIWKQWGIRPVPIQIGSTLRFWKSDVINMLETRK